MKKQKTIPPMVLQAATAIAKADGHDWDTLDEVMKRDFTTYARAAILAMREPTKEVIEWAGMVDIGSVWEADFGKGYKEDVTFPIGIALVDTGCREPGKAVLAAWQEMVDAALEVKPYHKPRPEAA